MAYAAVISLKYNIRHLANHSYYPEIIGSLYPELESLGRLLQQLDLKISQRLDSGAINLVDDKIRRAVWKVEDTIESSVLYRYHQRPSTLALRKLDCNSVVQEVDFFIETAKILRSKLKTLLDKHDEEADEDEDEDNRKKKSRTAAKKKTTTATATIGLSADLIAKIIKKLLDPQHRLRTVALFGMAGIGKTHFATLIYEHPLIVEFFDFRVWVRVGQKRRAKNVFVDIVAQIEGKPRNLYRDESIYKLAAILKKKLHDRRYLIVLDDMWSTEVCPYLISYLPVSRERRILLTTRLELVTKIQNSSMNVHEMRFLDNDESWDLLWRNVFPEKKYSSPPSYLEKAGKKIAENCEGLPLLIITVADILSGLDKTEEYWNKVALGKTPTFTDAYERILKVLFLSYDYLPQAIKACFLYMGVFPQSSEICVPKLVNLWAAEGFFRTRPWSGLEGFCMEREAELVSHSLVIVLTKGFDYKIRTCKLHSAYWYLCVKQARKTKLFHVLKKLSDGSVNYVTRQRRLSVQNSIVFGINEMRDLMEAAAGLTARSLLCTGEYQLYPVPICLNFPLLKVLDALSIRLYGFPEEDVVKLLLLRYLALTHNGNLPPSISRLQFLRFLIVRRHHDITLLRSEAPNSTCLPEEIWYMKQLRYLRIMGRNLPDPVHGQQLLKLLKLYVNAHSCSEDVFRSIPNLKKLGIQIELLPDAAQLSSRCFDHIGLLDELESLKCVVVNPRHVTVTAPTHLLSNFPRGLKKLSLNGLGYSWECMTAIGSLPNLQVLKLRCYAFQGAEWETEAGGFPSLKFLLLEDVQVVEWRIRQGNSCFPRLRRLLVRHCFRLKEIPQQVGSIPTLETMELVDCSSSLVASALQMQEKLKRSSLRVVIDSSWKH